MKRTRWGRWAATVLATVASAVTVIAATAPPAQAAVPDQYAFALVVGGGVTQADPPGTTVSAVAVGRWQVRFPGRGIAGGVVHVTAVHDGLSSPPGRWCQVEAWGVSGADELVRVACYSPGGALSNVPGFSVMFSRSSGPPVGGGHYGYLDVSAPGGIVTQYNSVGVANTVTHVGVGLYSIAFTSLGTASPNAGGLQVTAVNPAVGARCKVAGWSSSPNGQFARILCHNPAGAQADTRFTASYQYQRALYGAAFPPNRFGYLWNTPPLGPAPTNFNSSGVPNAVGGAVPATLKFPNLAGPVGNLQVTAYGVGPEFCNLVMPWVTAAPDILERVACYNNGGVPLADGFLASYSTRI